ncbi:MAG: putative YjeF-ralted carbohydrate kinase [Candidatus Woesebacteria bacterium GW2011_GWA1_41_13b]|uniref:Putative YjeF-ralted carbohydrate kinase n=1 Tax=Candidatus Woesebacteria bacterium GW2011_GWA1_41_13b TaxID=1618555 RepID=A0A0G0UQL8_9BACT|nr:MAG: putative YjeF-ralted carbohydrate kinase [Candidatus Woesebacteria bacterium GW2011_GWA1_41_13b]
MKFTEKDLQKLWRPDKDSSGEDNGQVTIIGGSKLFHGAPMLAVKAASRLVDMVFFGSPERDLEKVAKLNSFIWIPWEDMEEYVAKSEAILIGPGMMRYRKNLPEGVFDEAGTETRMLTQYLLGKYKDKKWVTQRLKRQRRNTSV